MTRGILAYGTYLPYRRLDLSTVSAVTGGGGGRGARTVAGYDEDTTTMAVEAARSLSPASADALWFSTTTPAYADKTNATAIHAALRLDATVPAFDANGSVRSAVGALRAGLERSALVVAADMRGGLPGSPDEAAGGDAAVALLVGEGDPIAEVLGWGSATAEFLDRWRTPGDTSSKLWEERFGEGRYVAAGKAAWDDALKTTGVDGIDRVAVVGSHARACARLTKQLGVEATTIPAGIGFAGAAAPGLALAALLDQARPGETLALVVLADGADVLVVQANRKPDQPALADQAAAGAPIDYGTYLRWRGLLRVEPPRRPEPARPSASAAGRNTDWKFGLVDSTGRPMADTQGTVVTLTIDRLAYSPSPPVIFAVVDFDGGGRIPVELTDAGPDDITVGTRVEMTFRKLFTADGIHNYFWKARPLR